MTAVFVVCAAVGVTVLVLQFLMTLLGMAGDGLSVDAPHDVGAGLGGFDHDVGAGDVHGDLSHDVAGDHDGYAGPAHAAPDHGAASIFRVLSLRTVVAALAFFGLSGLAAQAADFPPVTSLLIAAAAGLGAMYGVYELLVAMGSLRAEGTARIQRALGKEATVYLRIPGHDQGAGKVQINLQNRTMEYLAVTPDDPIPSGATVVVTRVLGSDKVQVRTCSAAAFPSQGETA